VLLEQDNIIVDPTLELQSTLNVYAMLTGELNTAVAELEAAEARRKSMTEKGMTEAGGEARAPETLADPAVVKLRSDLVALQINLLNAQIAYQPGNPNIKNIEEKIDGHKEPAREGNEIHDARRHARRRCRLRHAQNESGRVQGADRAVRHKIREDAEGLDGLHEAQREILVQGTITTMLTTEFEKARISEAQDNQEFEILDKAAPPKHSSSPKRMLIVSITGILSLFAGALLALFSGSHRERTLERRRGRSRRLTLMIQGIFRYSRGLFRISSIAPRECSMDRCVCGKLIVNRWKFFRASNSGSRPSKTRGKELRRDCFRFESQYLEEARTGFRSHVPSH